MKIAVMGAGAVGCYFGGMLARAGHDVTLVARPAHADAIRRHGLRLQTRDWDAQVKLGAAADASGVRGAQVVLFSVKSMDTEAAGAQMLPHLQKDALVLCLQNGVDNAERLRAVLPDHRVAAAVVYVATEMAGPGHVRHNGGGELLVEPSPHGEALVRALVAAGTKATLSDNVRGALWFKLVINCAYNAISAIAQRPYGEMVPSPGIREVMQGVVDECLAVAQAEGVQLAGDVDAGLRRIVDTMPHQSSSTAQDIARGRPTEIDYLNGLVVRRGEALGVPTPANRVLWALVKLLETKPRS